MRTWRFVVGLPLYLCAFGQTNLQAPLPGAKPHTISIISVFDHSLDRVYHSSQDVVVFSGELGKRGERNYYDCYKNAFETDFVLYENYRGTRAAGAAFLCYDGHPGFDFSASRGTPVLAAAAGTVETASDTYCSGTVSLDRYSEKLFSAF